MKIDGRIKWAGIIGAAVVMALTGCEKETTKEEVVVEKEVDEQGQLEGKLLSFSGKTLEMEDAKQKYDFDLSSAEIRSKNMRSGDEIMVNYDGEIDGTDTSNATVTSVEDYGESQQEEQTVVGTLVRITENTITIKQNDGEELVFCANNCEHKFKNGIREGNWVAVTYIGEIQGTDTKNVTVLKITDDDENKIKEEKKKVKIKDVDETVYATAGVHIRESYSTDSKVIGSLAKGDSIKRTGTCDNGWSRVSYKDKDAYIYGDYLSKKAPKKDAKAAKTDGSDALTPQQGDQPQPVQTPQSEPDQQEPDQTQEPDQQEPDQTQEPDKQEPDQQEPDEQKPDDTPKTATGTVEEVSMNTLSFSTDGQTYTVNISDAEHDYANGIQTGNSVKVTYTGDLSDPDSVVVSKVEDSDSNKSAENAVYTGVIADGTTNTITITTDDGATMTFSKDDAKDTTDGDANGTRVKITADAGAADTSQNILAAKKIEPA